MTTKARHPQQPDDERLGAAIEGIVEAETANATALDKAVLTLSSAALGLSLGFSKEIAPPATAVWIPLLFGSWGLFIVTIAVNIAGLVLALRGYRHQWYLAMDVFRHRTKPEAAVHAAMADLREALYWFNLGQGVLFVAAMICLASYVGVNFVQEVHMTKLTDKSKVVQRAVMTFDAVPAKGFVPATTTLERAVSATGYVPATSLDSSAQQQIHAATPQAETAPTATPAAQQPSADGTTAPLKK